MWQEILFVSSINVTQLLSDGDFQEIIPDWISINVKDVMHDIVTEVVSWSATLLEGIKVLDVFEEIFVKSECALLLEDGTGFVTFFKMDNRKIPTTVPNEFCEDLELASTNGSDHRW